MKLLPWICVVALATVGCMSVKQNPVSTEGLPAEKALLAASQMELFSLDPNVDQSDAQGNFHRWSVLGSTTVGKSDRTILIDDFLAGVAANDGIAAACFNPRHGIRITHNGKTIDFVICFECYQVRWYVDDEEQEGFLIMDTPQPAFDKVLEAAGIEISE